MRILKKILIIFVILLIGGFIYVYPQPNQYDVKRTHFIKAPANLVFEELIDFKNWKKWGPWYETDSSIEASYPELTKGVG
ncbi:MAG: SRPBCC family protein, partial [Flavobacteriales bacterium]